MKSFALLASLVSVSALDVQAQVFPGAKFYQSAIEVSVAANSAAEEVKKRAEGNGNMMITCLAIDKLKSAVTGLNNDLDSAIQVVTYGVAEINGHMKRASEYCANYGRDTGVQSSLYRIATVSDDITEFLFSAANNKYCGGF